VTGWAQGSGYEVTCNGTTTVVEFSALVSFEKNEEVVVRPAPMRMGRLNGCWSSASGFPFRIAIT